MRQAIICFVSCLSCT